jgi:siroheme decarboxylase
LQILDLPMERSYHIDLGFALTNAGSNLRRSPGPATQAVADDLDRRILSALADGLPLVSRPYDEIADRAGLSVAEVGARLAHMLMRGIITRFGFVVRHRLLGFTANAMAVWDVPDNLVDSVAGHLASNRHVTLCYRRPRRLPDWRYNLFCMVHARSRADALAIITDLNAIAGVGHLDRAVLFSTHCYKQRGAVFEAGAAA